MTKERMENLKHRRGIMKDLTYKFLEAEMDKEPQKILLNRQVVEDKIVFYNDKKKMREFVADTNYETMVFSYEGKERDYILCGMLDALDEIFKTYGVPKEYDVERVGYLINGERQFQPATVITIEK